MKVLFSHFFSSSLSLSCLIRTNVEAFFGFCGDFLTNFLCVVETKLQERKEFLILSSGMLVLVLLSLYLLLEAELCISLKVTVNRFFVFVFFCLLPFVAFGFKCFYFLFTDY